MLPPPVKGSSTILTTGKMRLKLKTLRSLLEITKILSYARSVLPSYRHQSCKSIDCYQYIVSALILTPLANYKPAIFYVTPGTEKLNKLPQAEEKANICGRNPFMFPAGTFFSDSPIFKFWKWKLSPSRRGAWYCARWWKHWSWRD